MSEEQTVRRLMDAFAAKDRAAAETLVAADFHFTSPYDNRIDRQAYFDICWPNSERIAGFEIIRLISAGAEVVVTYVGRTSDGRRFRNTEVMLCRGGQVHEVEVYFGWSLPHEVPAGTHSDPG